MTKEQIAALLDAAEILAPLAGPYGAIGVLVLNAAVNEAAVLFHKGDLSPDEVALVQQRGDVADSAWDAAVAKARQAGVA